MRTRERRLVKFLDSIKHKASAVYMLGDMFDFWFEYHNVVPKGYYGDVTGQAHMREEDNDQISLMAYEQLLAFKRSAAELKLSDTDVEKILYSNAKKLCNSMK